MNSLLPYIILITLISCSTETRLCSELENVHYKVNHYHTNMENLDHIEYYNSNNQILRWWKPGERIINYKYDTLGMLTEIHHSRTCQSVFEYEYIVYNDKGKTIGKHKSKTPIQNKDSISQIQTKFYDESGKLESEITENNGRFTNINYQYKNDKIYKQIERNENNEIIQSQMFHYNNTGLIDSIEIFRSGVSTIEIYKYNNQNQIVSKTVKSSTKIKYDASKLSKDNIIFDNHNHKIIYEYKKDSKIIIENRLNNYGSPHLTLITEKVYVT